MSGPVSPPTLDQLAALGVSLGVLLVPAVVVGILFIIAWRRLTR